MKYDAVVLITILVLILIAVIVDLRYKNNELYINKESLRKEILVIRKEVKETRELNNILDRKIEILYDINDSLFREIREKEKLLETKAFVSLLSKFLKFTDSYGDYLSKNKNKLDINHSESVFVDVSAYVMGHTTSTGKRAKVGHLAGSKDLIKKWGYGSKIALYKLGKNKIFNIIGVYQLEDRMNDRYVKTLDIRMDDYDEAVEWGRRKMYAVKL